MALVSLQPFFYPGLNSAVTGNTVAVSNRTTLDASGEYDAYIFSAKRDMTIANVGFLCGTATGSPTVDLRIETVAADGSPSGVLWATNTNIVSGTLTTNTWQMETLTASASVTKGQMVCFKILYNSGTSLITRRISTNFVTIQAPYLYANTGTPAAAPASVTFAAALGSSSTSWYNLDCCLPISTTSSITFNNTSSARRGLRFQVPFKCRCIGAYFWNPASTGDFNLILFDDAGSELSSSSTAVDGNHASTTGGILSYCFDNTVTLSAGTWYRVAIEPTSATNCGLATITMPSSSYIGGTGWGANAHYTTYVASSWTDTATDQVPLMGIIIDQVDDGTGSTVATLRAAGLHAIEQGI